MYIYEQQSYQTTQEANEAMTRFFKGTVKFMLVVLAGVYVIGKLRAK